MLCPGLFNRNSTVAGPAIGFLVPGADGVGDDADNAFWFNATGDVNNTVAISTTSFLRRCLHGLSGDNMPPVAKGYLRYHYAEQKIILPNLITISAVTDTVPLEDTQLAALGLAGETPTFDAVKTFANLTGMPTDAAARSATAWVYARYVNATGGMAKMNPGLDVHGKHKLNPPLTGGPPSVCLVYLVYRLVASCP